LKRAAASLCDRPDHMGLSLSREISEKDLAQKVSFL